MRSRDNGGRLRIFDGILALNQAKIERDFGVFLGRFDGVPEAFRMSESDCRRFEIFLFAMVMFFLANAHSRVAEARTMP